MSKDYSLDIRFFMMNRIKNIVLILSLMGLLNSCKLADLRTAELRSAENEHISREEKGKSLLENAVIKHGFDKLAGAETYEVIMKDRWKGFAGKLGNVWPVNNKRIALRFTPLSFDGQIEVLEGRKKGTIWGLQSWQVYKIDKEGKVLLKNKKRVAFGLAAFHYLFEGPKRLSNAPLIRYTGKGSFNGKDYDKVFVSWSEEPSKEHDQYVVWIEEKSGLVGLIDYTVRDNFLPSPSNIYATLVLDDYRNIDGIVFPFKQTAQLNGPKENPKRFIHQMIVEKLSINTYPRKKLYPIEHLKASGDSKPDQ
ncbi:hypothetical protein GWK08_17440 [Leptobacterium flavescens]|uniref:DUF4292 domain-containing protein n=1 Tax=Leptobacterium flavescens TaxID=472055 RepID=A0A6P0UPI5_9FLAO|nr:hypothetical protein [Leptobacterium flavescens]NER15244.1 hypothetical protein [Leptobacterium flavescens]